MMEDESILIKQIEEIFKFSTYNQINNILKVLPLEFSPAEILSRWGSNNTMLYFKKAYELEKIKTPLNKEEIIGFEMNLYYIYISFKPGSILSFEEFITLSHLLETAFSTPSNPNTYNISPSLYPLVYNTIENIKNKKLQYVLKQIPLEETINYLNLPSKPVKERINCIIR